jgi:hypothetical protein
MKKKVAKPRSLNFVIPLVIYPFDIMVSIGETDEAFQKAIRRHMPPNCLKDLETDPGILNLGNTTDGRTINFSTGHQTVIRLKHWPDVVRWQGILSHEVFHACSFVLWRMGIPLEIEKTDEVYAYLIDHVNTDIYKRLLK